MRGRDIEVRGQWRHALSVGAVAGFALLVACGLAGCGGAGAGTGAKVTTRAVSATRKASPGASRPPSAKPNPKPTPKPTPAKPSALPVGPANAGTLPQTGTLPKTTGTAFDNAVHDIWLAVTTGDPDYARPAFFPETAYEHVKAIADPESDWTGQALVRLHPRPGRRP